MNHFANVWRDVTRSILGSQTLRGWRPQLRLPTFLIPFGLATGLFLVTAFWISPPAQEAEEIAILTPTRSLTTVVAAPPTPTPTLAIRPSPTATRVPASLPTRDPAFMSAHPTSTTSPVPTPRPIRTPTPTARK